MKWDVRFLDLAEVYASWSKDPSTKVGAVITRGNVQISQGYNGFPKNVGDDPALYENREYKYEHIIHGEMNAIITAERNLTGCTLYTVPFLPCSRCAAVIIQSGIVRVVSFQNHIERWAESLARSEAMFAQAGVAVVIYNRPTGEIA